MRRCLVALATAGVVTGIAGAPAAAAANGWEDVPDPATATWVDDYLPVDGDTAFARGGIYYGGDPGGGEVSSYWLYEGKTRTQLPKPADQPDSSIWAATSDKDFWVVGNNYDHSSQVSHWNGSVWQKRNPADRTATFHDVQAVSADNVWAVGTTTQAGATALPATVGHWNGSAWKIAKLPQPAGGRTTLTSVHVNSATDIWAAGQTCTDVKGTNCLGYVTRYDGSAWKQVALPAGIRALSEITGHGTDEIWAAGGTAVLRWNGTTWSRADVTAPGAVSVTELTWVNGKLHAGLVVEGYNGSSGIVKWNGRSWDQVPNPIDDPGYVSYINVFRLTGAPDGTLWASAHYTEFWSNSQYSVKLPPLTAV
ncbi:hypothetical protein [Streptomyces sp. NPDC002994]|uniref:hypothetical protein n=1 Tax=Streptomyces sp. NPDC002994 TaxID=3154441 RepID=UPI0033AE6B97